MKKAVGENRQFTEITLYEHILGCRILNRENPKVSETYHYGINGITNKNEIVKMPAIIIPGFNDTFSVSDINLPDAAAYVEKAKTRLNMPDAAVGYISIEQERSSIDSKRLEIIWTVSLKEGVNEGSVAYDDAGNETLVKKNGEVVFSKK